MGVTCKTPAAVYKSTNGEVAATSFDQPIGVTAETQAEAQVAQGGAQTVQRAASTV